MFASIVSEPAAVLFVPVSQTFKVSEPRAVLLFPVVAEAKAFEPRAVLSSPEVKSVSVFLPIPVLFVPETEASKALSPKQVFPVALLAPLPIFNPFIVPSISNAGPPANVNKFKKALFGIWLGKKPADDDLKENMLGL